jgi:hypothetical protein
VSISGGSISNVSISNASGVVLTSQFSSLFASNAQQIGVGQTWQTVSRSPGVWYQNTTGRPIGVFGRGGIATPVRWLVGTSTSNFIEISMSDLDSNDSADYGWIIVPPNHFYQNIEIWANATELR